MEGNSSKIRVGIIGYESREDFYGYELHSFEPERYFDNEPLSVIKAMSGGIRELRSSGLLYAADGLDRMYRARDPRYMKMVEDFVERFSNFDLLIMSRFNPIHPEILHKSLAHPTKILGFIDDPGASYIRGISYLWAFDGAFYISPSYDESRLFNEVMDDWGCLHHHWWPLCARNIEQDFSDTFYHDRQFDLVYVGGSYGNKLIKLKALKKHFGNRFRVHGRWPLRGFYGYARGFLGKPFYFYRVTALSDVERKDIYKNCKIGFNMHLSDVPRETGNMRMYEIPAHGMMQVCDKAGSDMHESIFRDGVEAVYYDNIGDAIEKIEHYLANDDERIRVARAGHQRVGKDFWWEDQLKTALDWAVEIRDQRIPAGP